MARVTVEDSLEKAKNRFALTHLTSQRAKQLLRGATPISHKKNNREIVTALREIAEGKVQYAHPELIDLSTNNVELIEYKDNTTVIEDADIE